MFVLIFRFSKLTKTWKKGKGPPLKGFEKVEPCVIRCLKQYLLIMNPLRSEKKKKLLTSYKLSVDTVSCWFKEFLRLSGIDTSIFTGHSTRTASASKAKQTGLSLPEILISGQLTNKTTFETFYNKPVVDNLLKIFQGK